jgi:hypothetical protein
MWFKIDYNISNVYPDLSEQKTARQFTMMTNTAQLVTISFQEKNMFLKISWKHLLFLSLWYCLEEHSTVLVPPKRNCVHISYRTTSCFEESNQSNPKTYVCIQQSNSWIITFSSKKHFDRGHRVLLMMVVVVMILWLYWWCCW